MFAAEGPDHTTHRRTLAVLVLAAAVACDDPDTGPITPPPPDLATPDLRPREAAKADRILQLAIDEAITLDALALREAYADAMALRDDLGCPAAIYETGWFDNCETSGGAWFIGYSYEESVEFGPEPYWGTYSEATILRPGGARFDLSGTAGWGQATAANITYTYSYIFGTFHDEAARSGWFATEGRSADVVVQVERAANDARAVVADGSLGAVGGDPAQAVDFQLLRFAEAGFPDLVCTEGPQGSASVRLKDGIWIEVVFGDRCDGCGTALWDDAEIGTICPDFSAWFDWEDAPW